MLEKNIGEVIAEAREKKGLSQRQLAKLAKINNSELSKIESGIRKDPSPKILRKISKKLSMDLESLDRVIYDIQYKIEKENNVRKCKDGKVVLSFEE